MVIKLTIQVSDWSVGEPPPAERGTVPLQEGRGREPGCHCGGTDHTHSRISSVLFQPEGYRWAGFLEREGIASRNGFFVFLFLFFAGGRVVGRGKGLSVNHSELLFFNYRKHLLGSKIQSTKQGTFRNPELHSYSFPPVSFPPSPLR